MCLAAGRADELLAQVGEAINAGAVPPPYQESLTARANELMNTINCPDPVEPPPTTVEDDGDDEKKKDKKAKKEKKDDEPPVDELIPPLEEDDG